MKKLLGAFSLFYDIYYWKTAMLIARNGLARHYRNSFLGMLWTLLQPLTMVMVYTVIMPQIMRMNRENYALYIVVSYPIWSFFTSALNNACYSILSNGEVLKRCIVSTTVFPIADVLQAFYTLCISFVTMYTVMLIFVTPFTPFLLLIPFYFIPVLICVVSMAIGLAFVAPYIRDVGDVVLMGMTIMFWFTPVVYPITSLPPIGQRLMQWNPFYIMLHPIQMIAYDHTMPGMAETLSLLALTIVSVLLGLSLYRVCRRNYVYYL